MNLKEITMLEYLNAFFECNILSHCGLWNSRKYKFPS